VSEMCCSERALNKQAGKLLTADASGGAVADKELESSTHQMSAQCMHKRANHPVVE